MKVSARRIHEKQQLLWDWVALGGNREFRSMAETRTYCGAFYEEATRDLLKADQHAIDSTADICPDMSLGHHYLEVKSVGQNRAALVYQNRLIQDRRMVNLASHNRLTYVFWIHNVRASEMPTLHELNAALAVNVECVLVIPLDDIEKACATMTPRVMNYRTHRATSNREEEKVQMPGYRIGWRLLQELAGGHQVGSTICRSKGLPLAVAPIFSRYPLPTRMVTL